MTINDIMKSLYFKKEAYFVDMFGKIKSNQTTLYSDRNNCSSLLHIEQWLLINDLLNVACFLNQGWLPHWENIVEEKYIIVIENGTPVPSKVDNPVSFVYFSSEENTKEAIKIVGTKQLLQILQG
ncbi:MAG: hypothetical protein LBI60_07250 [Bacteroidales bacterium]|nr:hypothetical protein [Bacteroidales bacterium]